MLNAKIRSRIAADPASLPTDAERHEAEGLVDLTELLSLLQMRSERLGRTWLWRSTSLTRSGVASWSARLAAVSIAACRKRDRKPFSISIMSFRLRPVAKPNSKTSLWRVFPFSRRAVEGAKETIMRAIETTAVFEDPEHLRLAEPVDDPATGQVKVIVLFAGTGQSAALSSWPPRFVDETYGCCKDDPIETPAGLSFETDRVPLA